MLLFFLLVVGALAQDSDRSPPPGVNLDEILRDEDVSDLPADIQALIGSSQFGGPVAMGTNDLPDHGGAGHGEDYADGLLFGIDIDLGALSATDDGGSTISSGTRGGGGLPGDGDDISTDVSEYGFGDSDNDDGSVRRSFTSTVTDDSDVSEFDLSQFGIDIDDDNAIWDEVYSLTAIDSDSTGFDLSQFGDAGDDTDDGPVSDDDTYDWSSILSRFNIGVDEGQSGSNRGHMDGDSSAHDGHEGDISTDEDDNSGFDLSQFGIDLDDDADDGKDATSVSAAGGYGSDVSTDEDDYSGFDLSQFGIYLDDDADDGKDATSVSAAGGYGSDESTDEDDYSGFDLSQFGIDLDSDDDGKDTTRVSAARLPEQESDFDLSQYGINLDHFDDGKETGRPPISQAADTYAFDLSQFGIYTDDTDKLISDIPYISVANTNTVIKTPINNTPLGSNADSSSTSVEYATHPESPQPQQPLVPGFDALKVLPFDWQTLMPEHSMGLSDSLKKWIYRKI